MHKHFRQVSVNSRLALALSLALVTVPAVGWAADDVNIPLAAYPPNCFFWLGWRH